MDKRHAIVSLIAPVYGVEKYINQFLDSIRQQTFQDIEVILVDDGGKDNCPAILDAFVKEDERYHVIHQKNAGVSAARNAGLNKAQGEYVYIVDSDDWLEPDALEILYNEAQRTNADLVYADWVKEKKDYSERLVCFPNEFYTEDKDTIKVLQCAVNNNHKTYYNRPEFPYITHLGGAPWRMLIRRSLIEEHQVYFDPYVRGLGDDILFTLHLYEYVRSVSYIQKPIYHWRWAEASYTHGYKPAFIETIRRIFERMETFIATYRNDDMFVKSYYIRVILYLDQAMNVYFKNVKNEKSDRERYKEFKRLVRTSPFNKAISGVPIRVIGRRKLRIAIVILRLRLYRLYWLLKG